MYMYTQTVERLWRAGKGSPRRVILALTLTTPVFLHIHVHVYTDCGEIVEGGEGITSQGNISINPYYSSVGEALAYVAELLV